MKRNVFINAKGIPEVQPTEEETKISETGVIYLMRDPKDESHLVYKAHLHQPSNKNGKVLYRWTGMWNSVCHTGEPREKLSDLIKDALDRGFIVKQMSFSDLYINL